ncbi:hypothetical protein MNBD_CHLOROFLEXI01-418 [hydrothermal vent metagenome]|uniref:Uncharacterized protein n=1 Tax=hydrothermal vent metagenome TaxID=652676 RepID=A0A3B0VIN5_9ZZZZ
MTLSENARQIVRKRAGKRCEDHFVWSIDSVLFHGLTGCGRATVEALRLNNFLTVTVRRNWVLAGWHPPNSNAA